MTYHVNDLGDGRYELVELRPTVVGILTSRRLAERVADFLAAAEEQDEAQLDYMANGARELMMAPDAPAAPIQLSEPDVEPAPEPETAGDPAVAGPAQAEPVADGPAPDGPREPPLQEALRRLEAGEALTLVADETGFPLNKLRAIWANRVKRQRATQPVATTEASCTTCGKTYRAGATDEGLCARCTRDLGRA